MDIKEFSAKLAEATKELSLEERQALMKMFASVSDEVKKDDVVTEILVSDEGTEIPNGITKRLQALKDNYLEQVPSITTYRARAITKIAKENPGMPKIVLRAKCFRYCCETAPLVIQDHELIVGAPNGKPRAGAFSPDIAWRWMEDEIDTIGSRPQDPFYISDEDKKIMREELFPFWKGKSVDEYCEDQYREAGVWELSGESFVSDCSYHALNGGGDSNPGYDVILMKKGMIDIQNEAKAHLEELDYENPEDIEKIYFYKSIIDTTEAVICAWGMRDDAVDNETALQIRETTSALVYAIAVLPLFGAWGFTAAVVPSLATGVVGLAALAGTVSYLFYYKSISSPIGAAKSMALNISYSAWAVLFALVLQGTMPTPISIVCCVVILAGTVLAASDWNELFGREKAKA